MTKTLTLGLLTIVLLLGCAKVVCDPTPVPPAPPAFIQSADLIEDAAVNSYFPSTNYGGSPKLYTTGWTFSGIFVKVSGFLKFDYSSLKNAKISKAKLTLFADTTSIWEGSPPPASGHYASKNSVKIQIKRVNEFWSESSIVYNNKPASVTDNMVSSLAATSSSQSYTFDVTEIVKDQIKSGNNGFEICLSDYTPWERYAFYPSEGIYPQLRPKIEFEYQK